MKKAEVQVKVAAEDVDDIVEIASQLMIEEEDALTLEEMKEVGEDLDIPVEYIERAQAELQKRRKLEKAQEREAQANARTVKRIAVGGTVAVVALLAVWSFGALSSLGDLHAAVEAQKAQVDNVLERRDAVRKMLADRPDSPDKDAELLGAENRIRVESKRYSELAAKYNADAASFPASFAVAFSSLPSSVPTKVD